MINFRYHIVSLIAVFLALAIGVIMGSAVIDRAIVNRLEDQQHSLENRINDVEAENDALTAENDDLRQSAEALAEEGSERLLNGALAEVPILVVATRGIDDESFDALSSLLDRSGADRRGTLFLTDRFTLDDDSEIDDMGTALDVATRSPDSLRSLALTRLSAQLREAIGDTAPDDPAVETTTTILDPAAEPVPTSLPVVDALRESSFLDFVPPDGEPDDAGPQLPLATRIVFVSGVGSDVPVADVAEPLAALLAAERTGLPEIGLLAAEDLPDTDDPFTEFVVALREDDVVNDRLSTVDNLGDFAGRLAAVLAIADLSGDQRGHYGEGPGRQRLLPAPLESG